MDSLHKKRLLLLITNSYAALNVIHSGLIRMLADQYDIYLISDLIQHHEIKIINRHFNIHIQHTQVQVEKEKRLICFLRQAEKALFFKYFRIETQAVKDRQSCLFLRLFHKSLLLLLSNRSFTKMLLQILRKTIILLTRKNQSVKNGNIQHFDGVISTSPLDIRENTIVNSLKNMPSLAIVISWDNLTSKGIINANHDRVLVWNQFMANEYHRFYQIFGISKPTVCITGVPRFAIYDRPLPEKYGPLNFRRQFNIPVIDRVILFATSALKHFPYQSHIVGHLLEYAASRRAITVLLRLHSGDDMQQYEFFFNNPRLRIWCVRNIRPIPHSIPRLDTQICLAAMMKESDVCVQVASTIRLEAAICNKPCISIAYDGNLVLPARHSVKRLYAYSHQLPLNELELDHFVYCKTELFHCLDKIMETPLKIENGHKIQNFIPHQGAKAVIQTMKCIREWLS